MSTDGVDHGRPHERQVARENIALLTGLIVGGLLVGGLAAIREGQR